MPLIRPEQPADFDAISALLQVAFSRAAEARLVHRLRASGKIAVALVAEERARILGHVVFSTIAIESPNGAAGAVALARLAVEPAFQRLGIGSALVSAGLECCRQERHARVLVLGESAYYARFGFVPAARFGLKDPSAAAQNAFLAMELAPGAFAAASGNVCYGHEFDDLE
ncbi:MAG TPA: N-acetyltransferase [Burkholderiales bacterium]